MTEVIFPLTGEMSGDKCHYCNQRISWWGICMIGCPGFWKRVPDEIPYDVYEVLE